MIGGLEFGGVPSSRSAVAAGPPPPADEPGVRAVDTVPRQDRRLSEAQQRMLDTLDLDLADGPGPPATCPDSDGGPADEEAADEDAAEMLVRRGLYRDAAAVLPAGHHRAPPRRSAAPAGR
ncbi:hypothetical protein GCM10029964_028860 [Kibdelosporangium lantanae]